MITPRTVAVALPFALAAIACAARGHAQADPGAVAIVPDAEVRVTRAEIGRWIRQGNRTLWSADAACGPAPCVMPGHLPGDELRLQGVDGESNTRLELSGRTTARVHGARWLGASDALIISGSTMLGLGAVGLLTAYFGYLAPCDLGVDAAQSCALLGGFGWGGLASMALGSAMAGGGALLRATSSDDRVTLQPIVLGARGGGALLAVRF